jgi:peptide/nickel transport system permease protein
MLLLLARRLIWAFAMTWLVASLALLLGRVAGSDIIAQRLGLGVSQRIADAERHARGLDRPIVEQYAGWLAGLVRLDFGTSAYFQRPVREVVLERGRNTAVLATLAFALAVLVGVPAGVLVGSRSQGPIAAAIRGVSLVLLSCPPLLMSLLLVWGAAASGILPVGGMSSGTAHGSTAAAAADLLMHLPLPALALALPFAAAIERVEADSFARALADPCVTAARARGVTPARLMWHAVRLGAGPVIGVCGLMMGALLSGSFAVELVTSWPGLGDLTVRAMFGRDIYLSAGCAIAATLLLSMGVVASDVLLALVDPRVTDLDPQPSRGTT